MSVVKKAILSVVGNKLLTPAEVISADLVGPEFRKIELAADAFKNAEWKPGEKIQINVGDWNVRTYTPLSIDRAKGRLQILAYLHGQGPGSNWARQLRAGETCQFIGPRPSLELAPNPATLLICGDETSIPMAATFHRERGPRLETTSLIEVSSKESCLPVLRDIGLTSASLFQKTSSDVPEEFLRAFRESLSQNKFERIILSGNAQSIQTLRAELKALAIPLAQAKVKAYWAAGKTGID